MHGYRKRPKIIDILGTIYFILPFVTLFQFYSQIQSPELLRQILLSDSFLQEVMLSWTAGIAVLSITQIGFIYFLAISFYTLATRFYHYLNANPFETPFDLLVVSFWLFTSLLLLFSTLRVPYLNPQTRWWTQPSRYGIFCHGFLLLKGLKFPVITLDLSEGGVFLKLDERMLSRRKIAFGPEIANRRTQDPIGREGSPEHKQAAEKNLEDYPVNIGEKVQVQLQVHPRAEKIFPTHFFVSDAEVVWVTDPSSPYRYGLGLQFTGRRNGTKRKLKDYLKLMQDANVVSGSKR